MSDSSGGVVAVWSFAAARYVAVLLVGLSIGSVVTGWLWEARLSKADAEHATQITAIVRAASEAATQALQRQHEAQTQLSEIDTRFTQELANARAEADDLRSAIAAGQRQLRIAATCTTSGSEPVRSTTAASGMDDAAGPRLDDAAERDYWRLRDRIATITSQVAGLQAYIRSSCMVVSESR